MFGVKLTSDITGVVFFIILEQETKQNAKMRFDRESIFKDRDINYNILYPR